MKERIEIALAEIEKAHDIEILYACESGSRAWGFESKDSDYDVRFIYKRKVEDYLSVFEEPTELGFPIVDDLDFVGWDIKKVFHLLGKSNVTPFEWLQSPIVYSEKEGFRAYMKSVLPEFHDAKKQIHHYLGIVRGRMETMSVESMKLKSFFYTMRSLLSAYWIMQYKSYAPMEYEPLSYLLPSDISVSCKELLELKKGVDEGYVGLFKEELRTYILDLHAEIWTYANTLERKAIGKEGINAGFIKIISDDY